MRVFNCLLLVGIPGVMIFFKLLFLIEIERGDDDHQDQDLLGCDVVESE